MSTTDPSNPSARAGASNQVAKASGSLEKASGKANAGAPVRSAAEIEAELNATRDRLAGTVATLEERLNPRNVMERTVAEAKTKVREFYYDEQGNLRPERIAMTAGAVVVGLVGLRLTFKGLRWITAPPQPKLPESDVVYVPVNRQQLLATNPLALTAG